MTISTEIPPLETGTDGVMRIAGSRVTLDTVALAFADGATAEEIAQQYPTLTLANVYAVIGYYLRHKQEVDVYLSGRNKQHDHVRKQNDTRFDSKGMRERLMARRSK
jgi:uncharacterized protein (DUF433 family)